MAWPDMPWLSTTVPPGQFLPRSSWTCSVSTSSKLPMSLASLTLVRSTRRQLSNSRIKAPGRARECCGAGRENCHFGCTIRVSKCTALFLSVCPSVSHPYHTIQFICYVIILEIYHYLCLSLCVCLYVRVSVCLSAGTCVCGMLSWRQS